ncbi:MAG: hypothetical protein K6G81_04900 [Lachnospiraceae bacterium]|nr:hypothetical protein [Lachnospiraceae bacterium]
MKSIIGIFHFLVQWTWGILQNIAGLAVFLVYIRKRHYIFRRCFVTEWDSPDSSMGLGMFIFIGKNDATNEDVLAHEYGHTVQSALLGPLYLPVIGLPSLVWANFKPLMKLRRTKNISYYRFYPERWANRIALKRIGRAPGVRSNHNLEPEKITRKKFKKLFHIS